MPITASEPTGEVQLQAGKVLFQEAREHRRTRWTWTVGAVLLVVVLAVVAIVMATGAAGGSVEHQAAAVACGASVDPYTQSASALQACGIPTFPLLSEVHSQDGSTTYTYNVEGDVTTYTIPPSNFDFNTATPAQIAEYNVPPTANLKNLTIVPPPAFLVAPPKVSTT
jgi:ABC-type Na+ efflux pump permease subunit